MEYIVCAAIGYLIGTFNLAYLMAKQRGIDIKKQGTSNAGASNATIVMGWRAGVLVALSDAGKALAAVAVVRMLYPELSLAAYITGIAVVIGHIYPFYLRFNGGKGFASYLGMILALDWRIFLGVLAVAIIVTVVTDYIALATLTTAIGFPVYQYIIGKNTVVAMLFTFLSLVIIYKHIDNLKRIALGTEIGLRKVNKH